MRLIDPADEELFQLASVAGKLGRAGSLLDRLADRRRAAPGDLDSAFGYALAQLAALPSRESDLAAHASFTSTIEAFGAVLDIEPVHWLARYGRARLRALIPSSYRTFSIYVPSELGRAAEDLAQLCEQQASQPPQPYFASAHALAAVVDRLSGHQDCERWPGQLAAIAAAPRVPVALPALGAVLCEPFMTLYGIVPDPHRQTIGTVMAALYGDQPVVRAALDRQPAR